MFSLPLKSWSIQFRELMTSPFAIIALTFVLGYVVYTKTRRQHGTYDDEDYEIEGHRKLPAPLKNLQLNRKQLAKYNSENPDKTYLVALQDVIYDVSSAPHDFGPGGKYAALSGTEIKGFVKKKSIIEMRNYLTCLSEWQMMLEDIFYRAGDIIDGQDDSIKEVDEDEKNDDVDHTDRNVEELCEAGQGDNDGNVCENVTSDDEALNRSDWNDIDVTMVATT